MSATQVIVLATVAAVALMLAGLVSFWRGHPRWRRSVDNLGPEWPLGAWSHHRALVATPMCFVAMCGLAVLFGFELIRQNAEGALPSWFAGAYEGFIPVFFLSLALALLLFAADGPRAVTPPWLRDAED